MGAPFAVVMLAALIVAAGLLAFMGHGAYNAGAWLVFYALGNVLVLVALYVPADSFLVLHISSKENAL